MVLQIFFFWPQPRKTNPDCYIIFLLQLYSKSICMSLIRLKQHTLNFNMHTAPTVYDQD